MQTAGKGYNFASAIGNEASLRPPNESEGRPLSESGKVLKQRTMTRLPQEISSVDFFIRRSRVEEKSNKGKKQDFPQFRDHDAGKKTN